MSRLLPLLLLTGCVDAAAGGDTVVYLDRDGVTLTAGDDDAPANVSSLVTHPTAIAAAALSDAQWNDVVACIRTAYAPFAVRFVDRRPDTDDYVMAVFGGDASELGLGSDQHGIAPIGADRGVAFVFTANLGSDPALVCDTAVHELAHVFSVDHAYLASEPTSYLPFTGHRTFQDVETPCGETAPRACASGLATQSSYRILLDRLGAAPRVDVEPPVVTVAATAGSRGARAIAVNASDDGGIGAVTLHYSDAAMTFTSTCGDGRVACTRSGADFTFLIPNATGVATVRADAVDMAGNRTATTDQHVE